MEPQAIYLLYNSLGLFVLAADLGVAIGALVVAFRLDASSRNRSAAWWLFAGAGVSFAASLLSRLSSLAGGPLREALGEAASFWLAVAIDIVGYGAFALIGVALLRFQPTGVSAGRSGGTS
jgi:hypothetical protein